MRREPRNRSLLRVAGLLCAAALISACGHHGGGGVIPGTTASSASNPMLALAKAREINPQLCTFSAAGGFNADILTAGSVIWFNSSLTAANTGPVDANIYITHSKVTFTTKDDGPQSYDLPDSTITLSPFALAGSAVFHDDVNAWHVTAPTGIPGFIFANGGKVPMAGRLGKVKDATWSAVISTDTPGLTATLHWGAASYTTLGPDYNGMGVKPMDSATSTAYANDDNAGTPENFKNSLAHGGGNGNQNGPDDRWVGHQSKVYSLTPCNLGAPGTGPTPTPAPTPIPPGSTPPPPTPTPGGATPTPPPSAQPAHAAYIPNFADNNVSVIDTSLHRVTGTIPVGSAPYGVAMAPNKTFAYVTNQYDATVSRIDTTTGQVTATIGLAPVMGFIQTPSGVAFNPNGAQAYVATSDNNSGGAIAVIDTATNTETTEIVAPGYGTGLPYQVAVSADGTRLYVGELGAGAVNVYDTSSFAFLGAITLSGGDPNGIAVSPDGLTLYACDGGGLSYASTATRTEVAFQALTGGCAGVVLNATGTTSYVSNNAGNTVSVINTTTRTTTKTVGVGIAPAGIAITPAGNEVYVANSAGNSVSVISTSTNAVTNTIAVGATPYAYGNFLK